MSEQETEKEPTYMLGSSQDMNIWEYGPEGPYLPVFMEKPESCYLHELYDFRC